MIKLGCRIFSKKKYESRKCKYFVNDIIVLIDLMFVRPRGNITAILAVCLRREM